MSIDELTIRRINELYKKSKEKGLTDAEKAEQQNLRKQYLEAVRGNFTATLKSIVVVDENGNRTPLSDMRAKNKK